MPSKRRARLIGLLRCFHIEGASWRRFADETMAILVARPPRHDVLNH